MAEMLKEENLADKQLTVGAINVLTNINSRQIRTIEQNLQNAGNSITKVMAAQQDYWSRTASDVIVTPEEKKSLYREWKIIQATHTAIMDKAEENNVLNTPEIVAYDTAYDALDTYLNDTLEIFLHMNQDTRLDSFTSWSNKYSTYYAAELFAQNIISDAAVVYRIIPSSSVIKKDKALNPNVDSITWQFTRVNEPFSCYYALYRDEELVDSGYGATVTQQIAADNNSEYKCRIYASSGFIGLLDTETVPALFEGSQNVIVDLSNDNTTFSALNNGSVNDLTDSVTDIHVYEGITELEFDGSGTTPGKYTVSFTSYGCTGGSISAIEIAHPYYAHISTLIGMQQVQAKREITITGQTADGTAFTRTVFQTFSKAVAGVDGTGSYIVDVSPEIVNLPVDKEGTIINVTSLEFEAYFYYGITLITAVTYAAKVNGVTAGVWTGNKVTIPASVLTLDVNTIEITITYGNDVRSAIITVNKLYQGADGSVVLYDMILSDTVVKVNKQNEMFPTEIEAKKYQIIPEGKFLTQHGIVTAQITDTDGNEGAEQIINSYQEDTTGVFDSAKTYATKFRPIMLKLGTGYVMADQPSVAALFYTRL